MSTLPENIHPEFDKMLNRGDKQSLLKQRGLVVWLYGLSGSGKTTLARALEQVLHEKGHLTQILDGDNIRSGLNSNLGFSDEDRNENLRRIGEVAKLFLNAGVVTITSFITPREAFREMAQSIVGGEDFLDVYVKCSFDTCEERDVKGLYAKAKAGKITNFTGRDSSFEEPANPTLLIDTDEQSIEESLETLLKIVLPRIQSVS
ncbi:adenylyl-sulfate kinase [Verrucomicrobia bacterium]|nr:adenylyl-sulfate kinase [Verrucomicrobiota bacterium]